MILRKTYVSHPHPGAGTLHKCVLAVMGSLLVFGANILASPLQAQPQKLAHLSCNPEGGDKDKAPYTSARFVNLLDHTMKLQIDGNNESKSVPTCLKQKQIRAGFYAPQRWRMIEGNMVFSIDQGVHRNRVELRGLDADATFEQELVGSVQLRRDAETSPKYTIAQIYSRKPRFPVLRLEFNANRQGKRDHVWAVYRNGIGPRNQSYKSLGPVSGGFDNFSIRFGEDNGIYATFNGVTKFFGTNFPKVWRSQNNSIHYKAGCYLQKAGDCEARFKVLRFQRVMNARIVDQPFAKKSTGNTTAKAGMAGYETIWGATRPARDHALDREALPQ
ncbi:hypothetical protein D6851_17155 [Altericroceibacterium spongiae]|uniref:Alginate lyase 2 domain-containing protein n=1 Tax=Altericroceibacterium spongiae TaxID=2320269 RepID=A0A420E9M8_9SPHN|nr:polysaccharide lyase family 7 protein [Altericroceibacterium spongiae]RKF15972.1 hypothetical protein D6851_17155 [Altericroceibacterium spongiae]